MLIFPYYTDKSLLHETDGFEVDVKPIPDKVCLQVQSGDGCRGRVIYLPLAMRGLQLLLLSSKENCLKLNFGWWYGQKYKCFRKREYIISHSRPISGTYTLKKDNIIQNDWYGNDLCPRIVAKHLFFFRFLDSQHKIYRFYSFTMSAFFLFLSLSCSFLQTIFRPENLL